MSGIHPAVSADVAAADALVGELRRLVAATATHVTDAMQTARLAEAVHALADRLEASGGTPVESRFGPSGDDGFDPGALFCFDVVFGRFNPVALPVEVRWEPPVAVAEAVFTRVYEGPPDSVHGAVLAATFDQVCNVANIGQGVPGHTVDLEVRYRHLTRIEEPVRFEATVTAVDGREVTTEATARQGDKITADATGRFRPLA